MKTKIIFFLLGLSLFFCIPKVSACWDYRTMPPDYQPSGIISCDGSAYGSNTSTTWFLNVGTEKQIRLDCSFNLPLRAGNRLRIYQVLPTSCYSMGDCILDVDGGGYFSEIITTDLLTGCCIIRYDVASVPISYQEFLRINYSAVGEVIDDNLSVKGKVLAEDLYVSGNVGVGVRNPVQKLEVAGNILASEISGTVLRVNELETHNLHSFSTITNNGEINAYGVINAYGKVGIGIEGALPTERLEVGGTIKADTIKAKTLLQDVSNTKELIVVSGNSTTTTAYAPLHVENASGGITQSGHKMFSSYSTEGVPSYGQVKLTNNLFVRSFNGTSPGNWALHDGVTNGMESNPYSSSKTWWERFPFGGSGRQTWGHETTTYMTLVAGKLGIGIEPTEQLHVNGNIKADIVKAEKIAVTGDIDVNTIEAEAIAVNAVEAETIKATEIDVSGFIINSNGNVGIGVETPIHALDVNGTINAQKVIITTTVPAVPDYVFAPDYKLLGLKEVEEHINEHQHLPEVPSAAEMTEKGVDMIDLNFKLLQKIEELTLYVIDQNKQLSNQGERIKSLEKALDEK